MKNGKILQILTSSVKQIQERMHKRTDHTVKDLQDFAPLRMYMYSGKLLDVSHEVSPYLLETEHVFEK